MASVNKVILIGNVGKAPDILTTQSGKRIASFSIATSESWKDKHTGEKKEKTEWHKIVILNDALVGVAERFIKKGSKVYVEGQLQTRKWQGDDGRDNYTTEVALKQYHGEIVLLDGKSDNNQDDQRHRGASTPVNDVLDDDIPF